jgi:hypothetical protein
MQKNLKTKEAAAFLQSRGINVSPGTMQYWRSAGKGPPYKKVGYHVFYEREDLERFEQGTRIEPGREQKSGT